jgi:hypothetical protein
MTADAVLADFQIWQGEHPKGRDAAGWWNTCSGCGAWVWYAWLPSAHRATKRTQRDGEAHTCGVAS